MRNLTLSLVPGREARPLCERVVAGNEGVPKLFERGHVPEDEKDKEQGKTAAEKLPAREAGGGHTHLRAG